MSPNTAFLCAIFYIMPRKLGCLIFRLPKIYGVCGIGNDRARLSSGESTPPFWAFLSN
nr:MAG TPA: hypothetical protein [Caudoviricetes sp.]